MTLKWKDLGLVFDVGNNPRLPDWHYSHAQAPNAVVFEDFVRVYFTGRPFPDENGNFLSRAMYVDLDPTDSFKLLDISSEPILGLGAPGSFDEHGTYPFTVLRENNRYVALYGGWSRTVTVPFDISLGLATSDDGKSFKRYGNGPVLGPNLYEPFVITSPKIRKFAGKYFLTYTAGKKWFKHDGRMEIIYKLRQAESYDLINWTRSGVNMIPDVLGEDEAQACGDIFQTDSGFHMFFCYRAATDFRSNITNSYKIGYAFSIDLKTWDRKDSFAGINPTQNSWDEQMCAYPNVFNFDGKTYVLYLGNETGRMGFGAKMLIGNLK